MAKVNAEVIAAGGIGGVFLPPIAARSSILSPPFEGIRVMVFVVRPPRPRANASERLLLSYHFVTRSGVSVQVASGPSDDAVQLIVTLNDATYTPTPLPPSHDILVPLEALQARGAAVVELIVSTNPAAAPVLNQGVVTSRYDMPPAASAQDQVNVVDNLLLTGGPIPGTDTPDQPVDDTQPYPIYGWLSLGFAPSNAFNTDVSPGASGSGNNTVVLAKTPDGRIFYNWWRLGSGGQGWRELDGNGRTNATPAAALVGGNNDYLFAVVKGLDGNLYLNQGNLGQAFVGWAQLGFQSDVAPAAAGSGNNTAVVAKSGDGRIFYTWWPLGSGGQGWQELPGDIRTDQPPAAALVGADHNYLFVLIRATDGNLYLNQGTLGQPFVGWEPLSD
jgi:hypothetical protein